MAEPTAVEPATGRFLLDEPVDCAACRGKECGAAAAKRSSLHFSQAGL